VSGSLLLPSGPALERPAPASERSVELEPSLTAAQVEQFRLQGFLVIPELCERTEQHEIRRLLLALFERRAGREEGQQFDMLSLDRDSQAPVQPQIVKPGLYAPALLQTRYFRRIETLARQLLGRETAFSFDHSILKPAGSAAATPWHQDEAHHPDPNFHHEQISFWMPLQDVSLDNGCMSYVPGSNLGALLPHHSLGNDPRVHAIECSTDHFDESLAQPQPVAAGACILHAGRTLHSARPNRSDADRLVYVLAFRGPLLPRREPLLFPWLAAKQTASLERSRRWRRHGGYLVLTVRRLRQVLLSDLRRLPQQFRKLLHLARAGLRWLAKARLR